MKMYNVLCRVSETKIKPKVNNDMSMVCFGHYRGSCVACIFIVILVIGRGGGTKSLKNI
jgi:hypothetical protein